MTTSAQQTLGLLPRVWQRLRSRWTLRSICVAALVWLAWLAAAGWAAWYVASYGLNLPYWDEWSAIPYLEGQQPVTIGWLWEWHNEHRILLPKIVYLLTTSLAGRDVRGAMFANVLLMSLTAALGIVAARRLGGGTKLTDAVLPLSIAGLVNAITFVQGFQIVFVLTSLLFGTSVCLLAGSSHTLRTPTLAAVGVCSIGLPLTGAPGLILAVPLVAFIATLGWWEVRSNRPTRPALTTHAGSPINREALARAAVAVLICGTVLVEIVLYDPLHAPHNAGTGTSEISTAALQFIATALSPDLLNGYWFVLSAIVGVAGLLGAFVVASGLVRTGAGRIRAAGLLACWAGVGALALAVGYGRGYGLEPRYATLSVSIVLLTYLSLRGAEGILSSTVRWGLLIAVIVLVPVNFAKVTAYGESRAVFYSNLQSDIISGTSVNLVADKYYDEIFPDTQITASDLVNLEDYGMGPFATHAFQLNESPPTVIAEEVVPVDPIVIQDMKSVGDAWQATSGTPRLTFSFGQRNLAGIRLQYTQTNPTGEPARLQVWWAQDSRTGFGHQGNDARVWADQVGVPHDLTIWIGASAGLLMVQPDIKPTTFKLNRIVLLLAEITPPNAAAHSVAVAAAVKQLPDGIMVRSSALPGIYRLESGRKRGFPNWPSYLAAGGLADMSNVTLLTDDELEAIPDGALLPGA